MKFDRFFYLSLSLLIAFCLELVVLKHKKLKRGNMSGNRYNKIGREMLVRNAPTQCTSIENFVIDSFVLRKT